MKTHLAAALGSVVLTAGTLLCAPAAGAQTAAYPTTAVDVTYGASYVRGTLTWYNRSVGVEERSGPSAAAGRGSARTVPPATSSAPGAPVPSAT